METETELLKDVKDVKKEYTLEKHVQTVLLSIITVSIVWVFNKINSISESLVRMEEREKMKTEQITQMSASVNKMQQDITDLKERMTKFESSNKK